MPLLKARPMAGTWREALRAKARALANACERQFVAVPINEDLLTFDLK
jgi:hypothetical protein